MKLLKKIGLKLTYEQKWKDGIWLQEQINKKRLSRKYLDKFLLMKNCLDSVYPNSYDFQIEINTFLPDHVGKTIIPIVSILFHPIIRFEQIFIENSLNQKLELKDLFVKLQVKPDEIFRRKYIYNKETLTEVNNSNITYINLLGGRTTFSTIEYTKKYSHSHLQCFASSYTTNFDNFSSFCTGTGEINFMISKLQTEFNEAYFKTLLFQIKSYLEWEYLEGVPYLKLKDIFISNLEKIPHLSSYEAKNELTHLWVTGNDIIKQELKNLNYKVNNLGLLEINDDEKFEDFLISISKNISDKMLCYKDTITDTYYSLREVEQLDIFKQDKRKLVFNNSVYKKVIFISHSITILLSGEFI